MAGALFRIVRRLPPLFAPLLEQRCTACAAPVPLARNRNAALPPLCPACVSGLARRRGGYCPRCGNLTALPETAPALCGTCLTASRPWERFFFHGAYQGLLRDLILRFKSSHDLYLAGLLGGLLATHPEIAGPYDAVIPLPLHATRLRERGFNQAAELAAPLAKRLGVPVFRTGLVRIKKTRSQTGLSLRERKDNVRGIFTAARNVAGLRLLLVDDIATTCASLENAAAALLSSGAAAMDVAVLARTPEHGAPECQ